MHPDVCRFISDAVYGSRLKSEAQTAHQLLVLAPGADPRLKPTGLAFVPVAHDACAQRSEEEAEVVKALYSSLLPGEYAVLVRRSGWRGLYNRRVVYVRFIGTHAQYDRIDAQTI